MKYVCMLLLLYNHSDMQEKDWDFIKFSMCCKSLFTVSLCQNWAQTFDNIAFSANIAKKEMATLHWQFLRRRSYRAL